MLSTYNVYTTDPDRYSVIKADDIRGAAVAWAKTRWVVDGCPRQMACVVHADNGQWMVRVDVAFEPQFDARSIRMTDAKGDILAMPVLDEAHYKMGVEALKELMALNPDRSTIEMECIAAGLEAYELANHMPPSAK